MRLIIDLDQQPEVVWFETTEAEADAVFKRSAAIKHGDELFRIARDIQSRYGRKVEPAIRIMGFPARIVG